MQFAVIKQNVMNIVLWIMQIAIAGMFAMAGGKKAFAPKQALVDQMHVDPDKSLLPIRLLGFVELLAVAGLILPVALGIMPSLTAWAAVGTGIVMVGAIVIHYKRKEMKVMPMVVGLLIMSVVVAAYRF
jgi:hypothetical protein